MKNRIMLFSVFCISILTMFGQEHRLHYEIQQFKESNFQFDTAAFEPVVLICRYWKIL
jgi:hypothetical protein